MARKGQENNYIPIESYEQITRQLPIASVEALIVIDGALLFLKRKNPPAKGEWWFPGGRIRKRETLQEALEREIKEETGLEIVSCSLINAYARFFPERDDVTIAYLCTVKKGKIKLDSEHSEYMLRKEVPEGLHPYMKQVIEDSCWKEKLAKAK
jgi:ADP-ribose pyrophosphatase YjhB (NUDIX family)